MKNQESKFGINIGPFVICRRKQLEERLIRAEEKAFKRIYGSGKSCTGECVIPVEDIEDYRRIHGGTIENAAFKLLPTTEKKNLSKFLARNARVHCDRVEIVGEYVKATMLNIIQKNNRLLNSKTMNRIKLFFQYRKMLRTVRTVPMYDGRGQGTDVYVCSDCGRKFYTEYKDKGCTPLTIRCRFCKEGTMTHDHTIDHAPVGAITHYWVRPTFKQFLNLNPVARQHVLGGGLMLEEEL